MSSINYYLVLEKRLGDYNIIDINKLDIAEFYVTTDLSAIDNFTTKFSVEEIKKAISRSNITHESYLNGNLKIVSDAKHNLKVITKEEYILIKNWQTKEEVINQDLKNKIYGIYKKIIENTFSDKSFIKGMLDRFNNELKNNNKQEIFMILEELPYNKIRPIYVLLASIS